MTSTEMAVRLSAFAAVLAAMALWEWSAPRRAFTTRRGPRWRDNLGLVLISTIVVRLAVPLGAAGLAIAAREQGFGLLNVLATPPWAAFAAGLVALDLVIYAQHFAFHHVPVLWRLHKVHHTDLDVDASTGVRFHPVEILLSMGIKLAAVAALGPPPAAVVTFEALLNATSLWSHGNVALPARLERRLRRLVVTPEMHRVHHSIKTHETNSNFGFNLPWWDHLFRTYRAEPEDGHEGMALGIAGYRDPRRLHLLRLLAVPFTRKPAGVISESA
jgi:sterol desaturase/sphingolipid hydroxylase (fatty acid hydroxylase superfamily)